MDEGKRPDTYFADPARAPLTRISEEVQACLDDPVVHVLLDTIQGHVLVLNENRQFLAGNRELMAALGRTHPELVGLRPGEVYNCVHITEGTDGCGTSRHCRTCGAILAILSSRETNQPAEDECHLTTEHNGRVKATEYRVRCTPLQVGDHQLNVFVLTDISGEKRRQTLERVFFHDLLNTIGGLTGWSSFLAEMSEQSAAREIVTLAERLKEEVYFQRDLTEAEAGRLKPAPADHDVTDIFYHLQTIFRVHKVAEGRKLVLTPPPAGARVHTDATLVIRILINMVKNALEATDEQDTVTVRYMVSEGRPVFEVHNPGVIPDPVWERIFERAFSTRGEGRGLGTYSMKLFGENCLGGSVTFTSTETEGTIFRLALPAGTSRGPVPESEPEPSRTTPLPGTRNAMVVEPHAAVLRLTGLHLQALGFTPHLFTDPLEALKELQANPHGYELVVVDDALPAIRRDRFVGLARDIRPDLPVICTTPFGRQPEAELTTDNFVALLPKPYTRKELATAIESLLS